MSVLPFWVNECLVLSVSKILYASFTCLCTILHVSVLVHLLHATGIGHLYSLNYSCRDCLSCILLCIHGVPSPGSGSVARPTVLVLNVSVSPILYQASGLFIGQFS